MTRGRTLVVSALTAVLAASYVAVAQPAGAELSETPTSTTSTTSAHPTRHLPTTTATPGGTVSVGVPVVAFATRITAGPHGTLRTPVLLADPTVTGHASVWPGDRCGVDLVQGVVSWIVCDVRPGSRIRVRLSDGRVYVRPVR